MTKPIQYCRCKINLSGQNCHTVIYDEYNPLTWPEVQVLMALHGEENVMEIMPIGIGEAWPTQEKNRLIGLYGLRIVEQCFPGRNFRMEYVMTDETDLPRYDMDGKIVAAPKPEPKKEEPPPKAPPVDAPGTDHDDGEDEDVQSAAAAAGAPLPPIFKPGRHRPEVHKGA